MKKRGEYTVIDFDQLLNLESRNNALFLILSHDQDQNIDMRPFVLIATHIMAQLMNQK